MLNAADCVLKTPSITGKPLWLGTTRRERISPGSQDDAAELAKRRKGK